MIRLPLLLAVLFAVSGCTGTLPCSEEGCAPGQVCVLIAAQEQCAVACSPEGACPSGYVCDECLPSPECPQCTVCAERACVRPIR